MSRVERHNNNGGAVGNSRNEGTISPVSPNSMPTETTALSPTPLDTYFAEEKVIIPETESNKFSFRKLWAFTGPGLLMSIAYLDPGNIESDLQSGAVAQYKLLWVLLGATVLGLVMQRLSARLGVVTGLLKAVGIIGAVIMPHNLYLHSALVKSRDVDRRKPERVREANMYFFIEACGALLISFIINVFVVSVFAKGLYNETNESVREECLARGNIHFDVFDNNTDIVDADIYKAGVFLGCHYGIATMYIWAVGILAAGQSSTMTGTYAGQFAMEGFLNLQWSRWKRVVFTRTIAIVPTLCVAIWSDITDLSNMNDILNAVMSLQLPFATIPTIAFTSNYQIMGEFKNGTTNIIVSSILSAVVIAINIYFVVLSTMSDVKSLVLLILIGVFGVGYILMCVYLLIHMVANIRGGHLSEHPLISKYVTGPVPADFGLNNSKSFSSLDEDDYASKNPQQCIC